MALNSISNKYLFGRELHAVAHAGKQVVVVCSPGEQGLGGAVEVGVPRGDGGQRGHLGGEWIKISGV